MGRSARFAIGLLLYAVALPVQTATITVTNTNDSGPGSVRQALVDANNGDTINFAVTGTIALTSGGLPVTDNVTILGPAPTNSQLMATRRYLFSESFPRKLSLSQA